MIWFTSDLHLFHENILVWAKKRHHWKTVTEMNEGLVSMWNNVVKDEDTVYNLGDLAFKTGSQMPLINNYLSALKGKHILIKGNHDSSKKIPLFKNIAEVHERLVVNIQGIDFLLSHYPYQNAMKESDKLERPECYVNAQYKDGKLLPLICGHVHDFFQLKLDCLNCGFDAWGKMLSENDIIEIYEKTSGFKTNLEAYNGI
jgi:calcineurin-like phosphoesterase family protein